MATLTYWVAECMNDNACYSIVDKTKRGCQVKLDEHRAQGGGDFLRPAKRTILYKDAFDLMEQLTSEGGGRGYSNT